MHLPYMGSQPDLLRSYLRRGTVYTQHIILSTHSLLRKT